MPSAPTVPRAYRRIVLFAVAWTFILVVLGAIVRVTGSGLACPDWPLCHGRLIPPLEGPILIEYSHRLAAALAVGLVVILAAFAWRMRDRWLSRLAALALGLILVQALVGAVTVLLELPPTVVTLHLAVAEATLGALVALAVVAGVPGRAFGRARAVYVVSALAVYVLILTGAHVRGTGSALACLEWPLCDGLLPLDPAQAIHVTHRYVAALVSILVGWSALTAWRDARRGHAIVLAGLFGVQVLVGASYIWSGGWILAQAAHLAFATATWAVSVALVARSMLDPSATRASGESTTARDYVALTKPPIISLLLVTAVGGMFLAAQGPPPLGLALAVLVGGTLGAGGANALNHYFDRDVDGLMARTRRRPLPGHRVAPRDALAFGVLLNVAAFAILSYFANLLAAALTLGATLFYIVVYTIWLKRSTIQNIVIGGAAGAVPPLVGWAAIRGDLALPALYLFAIVFFWTPAHFWALASLIKDDYERARVPMLPVVYGERAAGWAILLYAVASVALTVLLFTTRAVGLLYLVAALVLGAVFVAYAAEFLRDARRAAARRVYLYSMLYLALLFVAIVVDRSAPL